MKCEICGAEFIPRVHNQKCCSPECSRVLEKQREKARYKGRHRGKTERHFLADKVCPICEKTFHPRREETRFCSLACYNTDRQAQAQIKPKPEKRCAWCGKVFEPIHGGIKYCSDECRYRKHLEGVKQRYRDNKAATAQEKKAARQMARGKPRDPVKPKKTIAQIVREAREHGMSYGQYMLTVEGRS